MKGVGAVGEPRLYSVHTQTTFRRMRFQGSQLNLHVRPEGRSSVVLVFVHGLGGTPYRTWGKFPSFAFSWPGRDQVDIAAYKYWTVFRPLLRRSESVDVAITKLALYLQELAKDYDSVVLIGHSLGGVAAQAATREYLEDLDDWPALSHVAAMILFAPPRSGSRLARRFLGWLVPAFRTLSADSPYLEKLDRFLSRRIRSKDFASSEPGTVLVPTYICYGTRDIAVSPLSARYSVDPRQCHPHIGGHLSCSKPSKQDAEQVTWLQRSLRSVRETRQQLRRQTAHSVAMAPPLTLPSSTVVTEFRGTYTASHWQRIYDSVRLAASTADVTVQDRRFAGSLPVDLLMAASRADAILREEQLEVDKLTSVHSRGVDEPNLQVRVTPVGLEAVVAVTTIERWLADKEAAYGFYIDPSADEKVLESNMHGWIQDVLRSDPRRSLNSSARVENEIAGSPGDHGVGG